MNKRNLKKCIDHPQPYLELEGLLKSGQPSKMEVKCATCGELTENYIRHRDLGPQCSEDCLEKAKFVNGVY